MFGEEQRLVELSEVCETFNGDRSSNYPSADERINAGVPFVNAGNLANGAIAFNNMEYVSEENIISYLAEEFKPEICSIVFEAR